MQLFDPQSANAKVIVLFTDGKTTAAHPLRPLPRRRAPSESSSTASA